MEQHSHGAGIPLQIRSERLRSTNPSDFPSITIRDEQWRYLPLERLGGLEGKLKHFSGDLAGISFSESEPALSLIHI